MHLINSCTTQESLDDTDLGNVFCLKEAITWTDVIISEF